MQVTETLNDGLKREYKVVLAAKDIDEKVNSKLKSYSKKIKLDGFRPGKAPLSIVKKKYGSEVLGEVLENAVSDSSKKILDDKKIEPAMQPKIDISSYDEGKDLEFNISLEIYPEVPKMDFSKIKLEKSIVDVTDKEIDDGIDRLRKSAAEFNPLKKQRNAKKGDVVIIDFEGSVDGELFDGGTAKDYRLELGSNQFIPGFEDQLSGKKKGEKVDVKVKFPEDYNAKNLAGKDALFKTTINDVLESALPEINDEFSIKFGFENVAGLRDGISAQIAKDFDNIIKTKLKKELFDELEKISDFEVPQTMLDAEYDSIVKSLTEGAEEKKVSKKDEAEYKKIALRRVRLGVLLAELAKNNSIAVNEEEIRKAVFDQARAYPGQEKMVIEYFQKNMQALDQLRGPILEDKTVDYLIDQVKITEKKISVEELVKFNEE